MITVRWQVLFWGTLCIILLNVGCSTLQFREVNASGGCVAVWSKEANAWEECED